MPNALTCVRAAAILYLPNKARAAHPPKFIEKARPRVGPFLFNQEFGQFTHVSESLSFILLHDFEELLRVE